MDFNAGIHDLKTNPWYDESCIDQFRGRQGQIDYWRDYYTRSKQDEALKDFNAYVAEMGLESVEAPKDEIKPGDRVRTKEGSMYAPGTEFVVTEVVKNRWIDIKGNTYQFFVRGDERVYGVWDRFIEKVEPVEAEPESKPQVGDYVRVTHTVEGRLNRKGPYGFCIDDTWAFENEEDLDENETITVEKISPPDCELPSEPGLYVEDIDTPLHERVVYVLGEDGDWSDCVTGEDAEGNARFAHTRHGLLPLRT